MRVIGLTGGMASGKTTVSAYLAQKGIKVIDADQISREICEKGEPGYSAVIREFGNGFLMEDGTLDRRALGRHVFSDTAALEKLEEILHPLIIERVKQEIADACGTVVVDAALLHKAGLHSICSEVWVVCADEKTRIKRIVQRDGLTEEEAIGRIMHQPSLEELQTIADVVITNDGETAELYHRIDEVLHD